MYKFAKLIIDNYKSYLLPVLGFSARESHNANISLETSHFWRHDSS